MYEAPEYQLHVPRTQQSLEGGTFAALHLDAMFRKLAQRFFIMAIVLFCCSCDQDVIYITQGVR